MQTIRLYHWGSKSLFLCISLFAILNSIHLLSAKPIPQDPIIISNPKTPILKDGKHIRLVFREELTIGTMEGEEEYQFGNSVYFNVDEEGCIYVTDWDSRRILKYSPQGKYLFSIGQKGQGPGEFQNVWQPRFNSEGNMYVSDYVVRRIIFYDKRGKFLRQVQMPQGFMDVFVNSQGFYIATKSMEEASSQERRYVTTYELLDPKFNTLVEFHRDIWVPKPRSGRDMTSRAKHFADTMFDSVFKPAAQLFLADDDRVIFGYPESYEIKIFSPLGRLQKVLKREYARIKVTKKHKDSFLSREEGIIARFTRGSEQMKKDVLKFIQYPKYKPAYEDITIMENGWIVVTMDSIAGEYTLLDIFDQEGRYIAQCRTELPSQNLLFKNGKAYGVIKKDGYNYIKGYSVTILED